MKASDLIELLQINIDISGDCEVVIEKDNEYKPVESMFLLIAKDLFILEERKDKNM